MPGDQSKRKQKRSPAAPPAAAPTPSEVAGEQEKLYAKVAREMDVLTETPHVLLNIPVWGWQYNGKTCAILTSVQYMDAAMHGIGLARVKDRDALVELGETQPGYSGLDLPALAEATSARLAELNQVFFVDNQWPPGTDTPNHYLLEVRAKSGRIGFVLFPDIMGGSYEKADQTSKNALRHAHAVIMLVDPVEYSGATPKAKEYRDDLLGVIQQCAKTNTPACVLLTKDDEHQKDTKAADETYGSLVALLSGQKEGFPYTILRVSVVGDAPGDWRKNKKPPPLEHRKPDQLIQGWVWALDQALHQPRAEVLQRVPQTNLKDAVLAPVLLATTRVPEFRIVRDRTDCPGRVVCATASASTDAGFLVLDSESGELTEVSINLGNAEPAFGQTKKLDSWEEPEDLRAWSTIGAIFVGGASGDEIWYGARGQSLERTAFPTPLVSWVPVADRVLIGVGANGTLHSLSFKSGKWESAHYYADFIDKTPNLTCGIIRPQSLGVVHSGTAVKAIEVSEKGDLGAQTVLKLAPRFDTPTVFINDAGFIAAQKSDNILVAGREQTQDLGSLKPDLWGAFALARGAPSVAWVSPEQRLHSAIFAAGTFRTTAPPQSPQLAEEPDSMCWDITGSILIVTFANGRWSFARRFGF